MAGDNDKDSNYIVVARMQVTMEHYAKTLEVLAERVKQLQETLANNHDAQGTKVALLELDLVRLETNIATSRKWLGIVLTMLLSMQGIAGWAIAKFWDNQVDLNNWKVQSQLRWQQHDRQQNYGNEGTRSYPESRP